MLQRLIEYAQLHRLSEPGFTVRNIRWRIDIDANGKRLGIIPSTSDKGDERWGCPQMPGMNSGGKAHFLVDSLKTAIRLDADAKDRPRHEFYLARIREAAEVIPSLRPLRMFLEDDIQLEELRATLAAPPSVSRITGMPNPGGLSVRLLNQKARAVCSVKRGTLRMVG